MENKVTSIAGKVGLVLQTYPGRTENFIYREIQELARNRLCVEIFSIRRGDPQNWEFMDGGGVLQDLPWQPLALPVRESLRIHAQWIVRHPIRYCQVAWLAVQIHRSPRLSAIKQFFLAIPLADQARRSGVRHLHAAFANHVANIAFLAARLLRVPYSLSAHAHDIWVQKPLTKVMNMAKCCTTCTQAARDELLLQFPQANIRLVRHGIRIPDLVDLKVLPPPVSPSLPLRIISAGRFVPKKGFDTLIAACRLLTQQGLSVECDIFGEGPLNAILQHQIQSLNLQRYVRLHPFITHGELLVRLRSAHLCVLPCRIDPESGDRDGIPNVILEAMACGTIVIGGDTPAMREVVEEEVTGYLVPSDQPVELARVIEWAHLKHDCWPALRRHALQKLTWEHDFEKNITTYISIFSDS